MWDTVTKPRLPLTTLAICLALWLTVLFNCSSANARDVSNAIERYRGLVSAVSLDDRCKILTPIERNVLNTYRDRLVGFIRANDAGFASAKPSIDAQGSAAATATSCDAAVIPVRGAYEDVVATNLSLKSALLTFAMNLGERCKTISKADDSTLMQAWVQYSNDITKHYSASIRAKYVLHNVAAEQRAQSLACSDSRPTIDAALKLAAVILQQ